MATKSELISTDTLVRITGADTIPEISSLWGGAITAGILYNRQVRRLLRMRYTTGPFLALSLSRNAIA